LHIKNGGAPALTLTGNVSPFIQSSTFNGKKPGYVFKMDKNGLGYYFDTMGGKRSLPSRDSTETETTIATSTEPKDATTDTSKTESSETKAEETTNTIDDIVLLEVPPHRFRQDKRVLTLLIQVSSIDKSTVQVEFTANSATLRFFSNGKEFGLRLIPPTGMTLLPTQCTFNVSDRNMAVIIAKEQLEKWGSEMVIEAFDASTVLVKEDDSGDKKDDNNDATTSVSEGTTGLLSNTLMYDLS
jgi:hypothetical protein